MRSKRFAVTVLGVALMLGLPMKALAFDHHHWHHGFNGWGNHANGWNNHQAPPLAAYNAGRPSYAPTGYAPAYAPSYNGYSAPAYGGYAAPGYGGYAAPAYGGYSAPAYGGGYGAPSYGGYAAAPYAAGYGPGCGAGMQHLMQTRGMLGNSIAQANYTRNWNESHRLNTQLEYTNKLINQNGGAAACGSGVSSGLMQSFMPTRGYAPSNSYGSQAAYNNYNRYAGNNGGFANAAAYNAYGRPSGYNGNYNNGANGNGGLGAMLAPFIR